MLIGYARVSTEEQKLDLQREALRDAGCERIFEDTAGGAAERPALSQALAQLRAGDTLVVWRLDRLGRSLKDLIARAEALRTQGVGLRSLKEAIDTDSSTGQLVFHIFGAGGVRAGADPRAHACRIGCCPSAGTRGRSSQAARRGTAPPRGGALPVAPAHREGDLRSRGKPRARRCTPTSRSSRRAMWPPVRSAESVDACDAVAVDGGCRAYVALSGGLRDRDRRPPGPRPCIPGLGAQHESPAPERGIAHSKDASGAVAFPQSTPR